MRLTVSPIPSARKRGWAFRGLAPAKAGKEKQMKKGTWYHVAGPNMKPAKFRSVDAAAARLARNGTGKIYKFVDGDCVALLREMYYGNYV